jgi:acyl dehydratase
MATELHPVKLAASADVVRAYAELTDDFNPIHVDPAFAAKTPMGGCIAHGTLSLGLLWQSLYGTLGVDAASRVELDMRFVKPVLVGETVEAGGRARESEPGCFDVWVRGADGVDRIAGTARLLTQEVTA